MADICDDCAFEDSCPSAHFNKTEASELELGGRRRWIMTEAPKCCIEADIERPCAVCGRTTKFVEYCVEMPICSQECIDKFYQELYEKGGGGR